MFMFLVFYNCVVFYCFVCPFTEDCANKEATEPRVHGGYFEVIAFKV
jgi:hypothetical protein